MKKRFKTVVTTAMVAALTASLLTGCGSSTNDTTASAPETGEASDTAEASGGSDGDSDSILIAGIAPLTGSLASWGEGAINGYNLAIKGDQRSRRRHNRRQNLYIGISGICG